MDEVRVLSPASVSNVVCGFDCLGFALSEPFDEITVRRISEPTVRIRHLDDFDLPVDPDRNVAGVALMAMIRDCTDVGFEVEIRKGIKPGSGIGSSAASAGGAVVAANRLLGDRYSDLELVRFAMEGERLASGAYHADNAAPCILGGFVLIRSIIPLDVVRLKYPPLHAVVIHPQIEIKTVEARSILPNSISLRDATQQWANLGAFVSALSSGDLALLSRSMEDVIVEPRRRYLIPKFDEMKAAGMEAGAIGGGISGSGPSVFMLTETRSQASDVETAIRRIFEPTGIDFRIYVSEISSDGVRMIE